ncbi:MAG: lysostaphin resistance A-like protein [Halodesulfurarchaeum sp.]
MPEAHWAAFTVLVFLITLGVLGMTRHTAGLIAGETPPDSDQVETAVPAGPTRPRGRSLLYSVAASQLLLAGLVVGSVWVTRVPFSALGLGSRPDLIAAILFGGGLFGVNQVLSTLAKRYTNADPGRLREVLAPESQTDWAVLLLLVLPAVSVSEEVLFRGALLGGIASASSISPWVLVVLSAVAFGLSHTAQGSIGGVVSGILGLGLGALFLVTGSLWTVVLAHYLIDLLEFVLYEGMGSDLVPLG